MKKILIVDDRTENRIMLANYFKLFGADAGITVLQADNSVTAVELAFSEKPDLILMDIKLETDEAGLEASRRIKENEAMKETPIWAVTAYASLDENGIAEEHKLCLAAGCSDYILKPFNPAELMKKISAALDLPIPAEILKRMEN